MARISRTALRYAALFAFLGLFSTSFVPANAQTQESQVGSKAITVERLYSAPSLQGQLTEGIEWSPDGARFSYIERKGTGKDSALELWTMDASTGERKVLVNAEVLKAVTQPEKVQNIQATGLGRVQADNYQWAPDGNSLLFVGGNSLVMLDLRTMKPKSVLSSEKDIEDPRFSPDGKWLAFVRNFNLEVTNIATGETKALTTGGGEELLKGKLDWVYPEELDAVTAYWWSPDSSKIAYYQMDERPVTRYPIMDMSSPLGAMEFTRFPQAGEPNPIVRVGVVPVTGGETKWMDTGANTDAYLPRVMWLRDSRRISIQRLNRAQTRLDLLFCDASTGVAQAVLAESDKYWVNLGDDLYFFADAKRFLWSSERTGFRHYYLYDLAGKQLEQLTSGDWQLSGVGGFGPGTESHPVVDEKNDYIYFLSNKDNAIESQLFRVSLRDKSITRITREAGTHSVAISPAANTFVDTFSTAIIPPRQDLYRMDGSRAAIINENKVPELAEYHISPVEFSSTSASDGTKLYLRIMKPPNFDPARKYPVLIFTYGGPHAQVVTNAWDPSLLWDESVAAKGYIIFSLDNRGSYGRGHAFETPVYHQFGKVELEDQLAGVKYLKSLGYVDGSRIGIWGWSYGGYMTLYSLFNAPDVFKAGIAVAPVSDWKLYDTIYTERYMGTPQNNADGYKNSSPVNQASRLKGRLMLAHGTGDDNVHFANTSEVINQLIEGGHYPARLMIFPGRGHPIGDPPARIQLFDGIMQFILDNL
ncbi:MAG TPA: S9 family peptidase [Candidatus Angelobacter sp.]|nr:S9 family peptidase [Candidatus Angelobacter sp.]